MTRLRNRLDIYVIYDRPADFPDEFVVRVVSLYPNGGVFVEPRLFGRAKDLESIRQFQPPRTKIVTRSYEDDPVIVETWL